MSEIPLDADILRSYITFLNLYLFSLQLGQNPTPTGLVFFIFAGINVSYSSICGGYIYITYHFIADKTVNDT